MLDLPFDMAGHDDLLDMPPNQLRICLMRAGAQSWRAEARLVAASDPFATLFVESINKDDNDMKDKPQVLRYNKSRVPGRSGWSGLTCRSTMLEKELTVSLYDDDFDERAELIRFREDSVETVSPAEDAARLARAV